MRAMAQLVMVHILLVFVPAVASAQAGAALTGIVTDSSGAVLPGVTVEARSPALIEQVRSAVTDETGRYRIVDLRPGTYSVTFTLPGFTTVSREGIELSGAFIANVNAELRVGGLQETVIAACAVRCLGGELLARLWPRNDEERVLAGDELGCVYGVSDLSPSQVDVAVTGPPILQPDYARAGAQCARQRCWRDPGPDLQRFSSPWRTPQ